MPEYLAPGVFVEEVSFRQKTIEGVSTSTTGFIGPTRFGPTLGEPSLLTSFADFERIYGGLDQLNFLDTLMTSHNFVAHAVRAYFEEGGKRLFVARTFDTPPPTNEDGTPAFTNGRWEDGIARWPRGDAPSSPAAGFSLRARYPGAAGNFRVELRFRLGQNILDTGTDGVPVLRGIAPFDVVWAQPAQELFWAERYFDEGLGRETYRLRQDDPTADPPTSTPLTSITGAQIVTVNVTVSAMGRFDTGQTWEDLSFHPTHRRSLHTTFGAQPALRTTELWVPLVFESDLDNGAAIATALMSMDSALREGSPPDSDTVLERLGDPAAPDAARIVRLELSGGHDGNQPDATPYTGDDGSNDGRKSGLRAFEDIEDISILAAPGYSFDYSEIGGRDDTEVISRLLIGHAERMRYRVAVLDSTQGDTPEEVLAIRGRIDSTRAALYYPWVRVFDPITETEIHLPPSGFVTGIYARNDVERGVHKAPANEGVRQALGFEFLINTAQQELLNPQGVNCLRFFEGRGFRVWGARTASSDPEWKYLNVRRYFAFLERSIERGTQWVVFENNGEVLWANVQRTVEDFLFNEWKQNHLLGTKPEQAYFVRCDRTTMTQNDLDNGRLVCLIGVAPLRPAEFVIFRIGQKTADARS